MFHVIEGFYGKPWLLQERLDMIVFLAKNGFSGYCYAPKADKKLRQDCHLPYSEKELADLHRLANACDDYGLQFTVGLSPYLFLQTPDDPRLLDKLTQLKALKNCFLGIFFDDVASSDSQIAKHQIAFVDRIGKFFGAPPQIFCPTYYSFDPIIETLFGEMPAHYLEDLGHGLPQEVRILWTGESVITQHYNPKHLETIQAVLKRKPALWDNAFVNDGRKTSPFLPLGKVANYHEIKSNVQAVFINPMNQASLSQVNLLMAINNESLDQALEKLMPELAQDILCYLPVFTEQGLEQMTLEMHQELLHVFSKSKHPAAINITDWLNGVYRFDPDCLT